MTSLTAAVPPPEVWRMGRQLLEGLDTLAGKLGWSGMTPRSCFP